MPEAATATLVVRRVVLEGRTIVVEADGRADGATCPACGEHSTRVHGRYTRHLVGAPWHGYAVRLLLTVRSFCCPNPACPRATFTEAFGEAAPPRARWTGEARRYVQQVGGRAGAEAGARLATAAGLPVSPDTVLRLRSTPAAPGPAGAGRPDRPALGPGLTAAPGLRGPEPSPEGGPPDTGREGEAFPAQPGVQVLAAWLRKCTGAEVVVRERHEAPGRPAS